MLRHRFAVKNMRQQKIKRRPPTAGSAGASCCGDLNVAIAPFWPHFIAVFTEVKVVLRAVPRGPTTTTTTIEMPAAMRPCSIAVAPDSSRKSGLHRGKRCVKGRSEGSNDYDDRDRNPGRDEAIFDRGCARL